MLIEKLLRACRYLAPAGEDGSAVDRGDDFTPTDDESQATTGSTGAADIIAKAEREAEERAAAANAAKEGKEDKAGEKQGLEKGTQAAEVEEDKGAEKPKGKGIIPVDRHEAILAKERERREQAERELSRYQGGERVAQVNTQLAELDTKIDELEAKHSRLIVDGEHEKATAAMKEIRALERQRSTAESDMRIAEATARTAESTRFSIAKERVEEAYPELDPKSDQFDEDKTDTVVLLMQGMQARGMTPTESLQKAVRKIMGTETSRQAAATTVKPRVDAAEAAAAAVEAANQAATKLAAERKQGAIDKALDAERRQPASTAGVGKDGASAGKGSIDMKRMTQDQFAKLTPEDRAKARGDMLEA